MHKGFFIDVMQHRPALFATMLAFNGLQALEQHNRDQHDRDLVASNASVASATRALLQDIQGLSASSVSTLAASPVVQRHMLAAPLTDTATSSFSSLSTSTFWDFAEESRRLIFLSQQELSSLLLLFGIALHANDYAHMVNHADVLALRRALGAEAYTYGLVRGRFQLGSIAKYFVFRNQTFGNTAHSLSVDTILHNIARDGEVALALCMATWPQSLQDRACTLLGRTIHPILDADAAATRGVWFALKKLLLREVAPQWAPCFD